jgi:hypothetical protein
MPNSNQENIMLGYFIAWKDKNVKLAVYILTVVIVRFFISC